MHFNLSHVSANPIVLASAILSAVAWIIAFIATCVSKAHDWTWWIIVYELMLHAVLYLTLAKSIFANHFRMVLFLLAISITMLTQWLEALFHRSDGAAKAAAAGVAIMVIMQYLWVFIFGSSESSFVHQAIYGLRTPKTSMYQMGNYAEHITKPSDISKRPRPTQAPVVKDLAKALHRYEANPEDPSELSFEKGDILEILDRRGNWWQARNSQGVVGIVPSNYF